MTEKEHLIYGVIWKAQQNVNSRFNYTAELLNTLGTIVEMLETNDIEKLKKIYKEYK